MANYVGIHHPTKEAPFYYEYPSSDVCTLVASGNADNELGCPFLAQAGHPYNSCSHGLDSYVCEFAKK